MYKLEYNNSHDIISTYSLLSQQFDMLHYIQDLMITTRYHNNDNELDKDNQILYSFTCPQGLAYFRVDFLFADVVFFSGFVVGVTFLCFVFTLRFLVIYNRAIYDVVGVTILCFFFSHVSFITVVWVTMYLFLAYLP